MSDGLVEIVVKAGTLVHIQGVPYHLKSATILLTNSGNVGLLNQRNAGKVEYAFLLRPVKLDDPRHVSWEFADPLRELEARRIAMDAGARLTGTRKRTRKAEP